MHWWLIQEENQKDRWRRDTFETNVWQMPESDNLKQEMFTLEWGFSAEARGGNCSFHGVQESEVRESSQRRKRQE